MRSSLRRRLVQLCCAILVVGSAAVLRPDPVTATPAPRDGATHFLDDSSYLTGFTDQQWYRANIPFVDLPDKTIQSVYYYRWRTWKEHLRYTDPTNGWISTEFLDCCGYAAPYQAIDAAAGHQITEGRWVRNQTYDDDYVKFWLTGPGAGAKPATDGVNADTTDWAHEYSFWLASAAYGQAQVTGDFGKLIAMLPDLVRQYRGWDKQFNSQLGLYWSVPVWDAMEFSASSYQSGDPYHGGAGYRPTLNSYQYGDALAISKLAAMAGQDALAQQYAQRAASLKTAMQRWLWDPQRHFYYAMARDGNPDHRLLDTREEIGYLPWQVGAASAGDSSAWTQLLDPQGFASAYGPTTAERRSPWFMHDAGGCCRWDGPSWPFATSQTLSGMANLLDEYPAQQVVTPADYTAALHTYAATQYRDGTPYVAEAHDPDQPNWIYDGYNHSEDYNHSTFVDLVLSGLLGLRPSSDNTLAVHPLVPSSWDHFVVENAPYHGHNVTVLYDRDGTHYGQGSGLRIYVDGALVKATPGLGATSVQVGPTRLPDNGIDDATRQVNDAANPLRTGYPRPITSDTWRSDDAWNALDGKVWFNEVPEDTRWTNYSSPNAQDYYGVDFGVPTRVGDVRWYGYDDGGGVRPAAAYQLQYRTGSGWADVPGQDRNPVTPVGNGSNEITFPTLTTSAIRLVFTNPSGGYVGVTELQSWSTSSDAVTLGVGGNPTTVDGPTAVPVTVTNTTTHALRSIAVSIATPPDWSATQPAPVQELDPGASTTVTTTVTPPAEDPGGTVQTVVATARYLGRGAVALQTHARGTLRTAFPVGQHDAVGSWPLDEGSGDLAHDASGNEHDATLVGGPSWVVGTSGTALQFDSSTQYAETRGPVVDTVGNFTVSAWVRLDSTAHWATAVSQDGNTSSGFYLQYSQADGRFAFSTAEGRALADTAPTVGRWYHLVGVHDANAGTYTLYLDGVAQSRVNQQVVGDPANGPFAIGRGFSGGGRSDFFPGAVDSVQVWNRALSAEDVARL
ncbi:MAG TPA: LamG-like jellyroll fold domain-containing protein [Jatrophihabitans sp.]